jgi:hypothetical protein
MSDYYTEEGCPIKCMACGHDVIRERVIAMVDFYNGMGPPCEIEYVCEACGTVAGYWLYGVYDPGFMGDVVPNPAPVLDS